MTERKENEAKKEAEETGAHEKKTAKPQAAVKQATEKTARNVEQTDTDTDSNEPVVVVKHLSKSFGAQQVLEDVSLEMYKGENLVVLGKSGAGKSVLIKCLVGLEYPDRGEVTVLGEKVTKLKYSKLNKLRKRIGFLFQSGALYDSLSVRENLEFPLRKVMRVKRSSETTKKIEEVLEAVGLADAIDKMPSELSGGMRKRIGLARTLILEPEIILYDEPTTGLDPVTSLEISQLIVQIQQRFHTSSLIITHDMGCVRTTANRVVMLRDGKVYATGTLQELEQSSDEWIQSFFNSDNHGK